MKYIVHKLTLECIGAYHDDALLPFIIPYHEQDNYEYIESTLQPEQAVVAKRDENNIIVLSIDETKLQEYKNIMLTEIREYRNTLLAKTDYCVLPDTQLTQEKLDEIKKYRQDLRDITKNIDVLNPVYPSPPYWFGL